MRTKKMTRKEFALQILQQTYPFDDSEVLNKYINGRNWSDAKSLTNILGRAMWADGNEASTGVVDSAIVEDIAYGMNEYIRGYQSIPVFKQKIWEQFYEWLRCIIEEYHLVESKESILEILEKPLVEDTNVSVVKAIHSAKSKKEIAEMLSVSDKTVQTALHLLDPTLDQDPGQKGKNKTREKRNAPRFGGQIMQVEITTEDVDESSNIDLNKKERTVHKYKTKESLSPVALQMSVWQVGILLKGMQLAYDAEVSYHSMTIAINVWSQLSAHCRTRLKENYHPEDEDFHVFLQAVEDAENGKPFMTEKEMFDTEDASIMNQLNLVHKGERLCNIKYQDKVMRNCTVSFDFHEHKYVIHAKSGDYIINEPDEVDEILLLEE